MAKIFLVTSTDGPIWGFLFKALVKPPFAVSLKQDKKILRVRAMRIQKFGSGKEVSTSEDLFGPYLDLLLQGMEIVKKEYEVQLYV